LLVFINPVLGGIGFGVDWFAGSGRSFDDKILRLTDKKRGNKVAIGIENIKKIPEHYILASAGIGCGTIDRIEEKNTIYRRSILRTHTVSSRCYSLWAWIQSWLFQRERQGECS